MSDTGAFANVGARLVTQVQPLDTSRLQHYPQTAISSADFTFNLFRIEAILHGVLARAQHGNAASDDAIATGDRARLMADVARAMAQGNSH